MPKLDLQQVISVADTLLQPLEGTFADASGAPTADCDKRDALRHHSLAVSAFATLTDYILQSQVEPPEEHANRQHSSPFIYELSPEEAVLHEQASQRQKLLVKSCLAALLYAEDSALLAPWSSHQLYLAASSLFVGLCQKVPVHKTNESPVADSGGRMYTQQDFLLWLMPALLPELSAHLKAEDSYNDVHFDATKGTGQCRVVHCNPFPC